MDPIAPTSTPAPTPGPPSRARVIGAGVTWLSRWTLRWLVVGAGLVALFYLLQYVWPVVFPVVLALLVSTVLEPPARLLHTRLHVPRGAASFLMVVLLVAVAGLGSWLIAPAISDQLVRLAQSVSDALDRVEQWVTEQERFEVTAQQVERFIDAVQQRLQSSASAIASGILVGITAVTSALVTTVVTLVLAFFFVKDGHRFLPWLQRWTGASAGHHLAEVARRSWHVVGSFIRTQALVGLIDATLIGVGLLVVGVPLALPLAVLTFAAAFAPIVGAITVGALAVLVALVSLGWVEALIVLAIVLGVQQLEGNVLLPWLQGRNLHLPAVVVLLAIILGSSLFGIAGAFLAVPTAAVGAAVLRYLDEQVVAHAVAEPHPTGGSPGARGGHGDEPGDGERADEDR